MNKLLSTIWGAIKSEPAIVNGLVAALLALLGVITDVLEASGSTTAGLIALDTDLDPVPLECSHHVGFIGHTAGDETCHLQYQQPSCAVHNSIPCRSNCEIC